MRVGCDCHATSTRRKHTPRNMADGDDDDDDDDELQAPRGGGGRRRRQERVSALQRDEKEVCIL